MRAKALLDEAHGRGNRMLHLRVQLREGVRAGSRGLHSRSPPAPRSRRSRGEHEVDPIADLRPVCPNCHSVLHSRVPAYRIEDVRAFLERQTESPALNAPLQRTSNSIPPAPPSRQAAFFRVVHRDPIVRHLRIRPSRGVGSVSSGRGGRGAGEPDKGGNVVEFSEQLSVSVVAVERRASRFRTVSR